MKGDHGKHKQNNHKTFKFNNMYNRNTNVEIMYIAIIHITQMMMGKQWVNS